MPEFYTPVSIPQSPFRIGYHSKLFFMGSCFAEHIGKRMVSHKFDVCHNPYGVIYNPLSMAKNLQLLIEKDEFTSEDLEYFNELWFSFNHYTLFSHTDKNTCLEGINQNFVAAKKALKEADVLFLTLGTSYVFVQKRNGEVVNNCHKIPANKFERFFSSTQQTVDSLGKVLTQIKQINPGVKFVFTVSPVRHWKDGAIANQRSKSALLLAIAEFEKILPDSYYFPAYEIFMDELRDYRFYAPDHIHPSSESLDYIWYKFTDTFFEEDAKGLTKRVNKILMALGHKPRFTDTETYRKFIATLISSVESIQDEYPFLDFYDELSRL